MGIKKERLILESSSVLVMVTLTWSLLGYLLLLYCGRWFSAGVYAVLVAVNCGSLWILGRQSELQRALDEVDRVKRECLVFMLRLPGQLAVTCHVYDGTR